MLSGLLLLTWLVASSVLSQASTLPKRIVPIIAFAGSQSFLFLFYLFLIPLGSTNSAKLLLAVYALTGVGFFALQPLRLGNAVQTIRHFLQLQQPTSLSIMGESAILRRYFLQTTKAKIFVTTSAICHLPGHALFNPDFESKLVGFIHLQPSKNCAYAHT
jgi:hypothetical protein